MTSDTDICNIALDILGADPITSLEDDGKSGRLCKRNFALVRDAVLRAYPWNCARERTTLPALATAPAFGFAFAYQQPSDCLRVWRLTDAIEQGGIKWRAESRKILTDVGAPLPIHYIRAITDASQFDPILVQAIAARLASTIGFALTGLTAAVSNAAGLYTGSKLEAQKIDAQEQGTPDELSAPDWIESRG